MKKFLILITVLTLSIALAGCEKIVEVPMELPEIPETVDMTNVDDYLGRPDVQYVDLRNFDDKMNSGYIAGFEFIPFFDYLEVSEILVRTNSWTFEAAGVKNESALKGLFDEDKTIFLMCGSGTRAGFVLDALESLGYENVYNVGGIKDYAGTAKVFGDGVYNVEVQLPLPETVDMTNIDMYLGRNDVQYVDLRNFDDKMNSGYIAGFEFIPFFEYLEYSDILVRTNSWTFEAAGIENQAALEGLFDMDKTIFLMCGSGTRAGFVMDALVSLGYDVVNVGGIKDYAGDNKVFGDGTYNLTVPATGPYTPGVYFALDITTQYTATVVIGANGAIENVIFDAVYHETTKNTLGSAYTLGSGSTWAEEAAELAAYIVANQGWDGIELDITDIGNGGHFVENDLEDTVDPEMSPDSVSGVTIGMEGFALAWNMAIKQATEAGTEGIVADIPHYAEVVARRSVELTDNQYYGYEGGYLAVITVDETTGDITEVYLDAVHFRYGTDIFLSMKRDYTTPGDYPMNYTFDDKGNDDKSDDEWVLAAGKLDWWAQADALEAAILAANGWDATWTITDGGFGADEVAGVSIGVTGWQAAVEEAIAKIPTS